MLLAWALAVELERLGAIDQAFIAANVLGFEEFMARAREWPAERAAGECGLAAEDIRTCARWLAEADPLVMSLGNGLERSRNGGSGIRAAIALPALLGKLGRRSGIVLGAGNAFPKTPAKLQRPGPRAARARARSISSTSAGTWCATTSIRRCGRCSSTTTTRSSCIPTRTACAGA